MVKVPSFRFEQCLGQFTMFLIEAYCRTTTFFGVRNVRYILAMNVIFFWKMFKI